MFAERIRRPRHQPGEYINDGIRQKLTERAALARRRHEEGLAALPPQRGRDFRHAETVGVGFHHGGAFGRADKLAQAPVIGGKRVEINGEDRGLSRILDIVARW